MPLRTRFLAALVLTAWLGLAARLVAVQWLSGESLARQATRQRLYEEVLSARPGDIVDRAGRLLATTSTRPSLFVDPSRLSDPDPAAAQIAAALMLDVDAVRMRLQTHRQRRFVWIKRRLTDEEVDAVRTLDLPPLSWGLREEFTRVYPQGSLAAHVIGWRNIDGVGQAGVERTLDRWLRGTDGRRTLVRDARGYVVDVLQEVTVPPQHGSMLTLTIDSVVQLFAEEELDRLMSQWKATSAVALVIEPATGELLAMAARPTFDPNHPGQAEPRAWTNPAVSLAFEPGSTVKPLFVARALDAEVVAREDILDCEQGAYRMGRRVLHDHHPYGRLSLTDVLVKSSNIGIAKIGQRMTNERLHACAAAFGFGRRTGIELPGESPGHLRPLAEWDGYSTGSVPMGQEFSVTPLQLIAAHAALANGGRWVTPQLCRTDFQSVRDHEARIRRVAGTDWKSVLHREVVVTQIVDPSTADWLIQQPLTEVVRRGTAQRAQVDGYTVFGKTGTAQKYNPASGRYSTDRSVTSCIVGAPAETPRILVLVLADEPISTQEPFGGLVAAPAAARILKRTLRYLAVPEA